MANERDTIETLKEKVKQKEAKERQLQVETAQQVELATKAQSKLDELEKAHQEELKDMSSNLKLLQMQNDELTKEVSSLNQ